MKITDYTVIQNAIQEQLLDQDWSIEDYLSETAIVLAISNIYTTNDIHIYILFRKIQADSFF